MLERLMVSTADLSNAMLSIIIKESASRRNTLLSSLSEEEESYFVRFKEPTDYFSGLLHIIVQVKQHCIALQFIL